MKENNYFPEYTFHDATHIENVLNISLKLIPDNIYKKLGNESIEYLVVAILLHDLGMFISRDGLNNLIFGKQKNNLQFDLLNKTWGELWSDYYSKAKRYDDKKLFEIFGDNQPVDRDITSCVPIENNNHQRLLLEIFCDNSIIGWHMKLQNKGFRDLSTILMYLKIVISMTLTEK